MPIYNLEIEGRRKRVLVKAESAAKARDEVVKATALTAEEMVGALADGEQVWTPGTPLPEDDAAPEGDAGTE